MKEREVHLPAWAVASEKRRAHIGRVVALLEVWAKALRLDADASAAWRDAGLWHDALRDAPAESLGPPSIDPTLPPGAWHGPAAAVRLRSDGESRESVLSAIAWHTVGSAEWDAVGQALYCADFLEPARPFRRADRESLAARYPSAPHDVLREVVRMRMELALGERVAIHPRTVELWEAVR